MLISHRPDYHMCIHTDTDTYRNTDTDTHTYIIFFLKMIILHQNLQVDFVVEIIIMTFYCVVSNVISFLTN